MASLHQTDFCRHDSRSKTHVQGSTDECDPCRHLATGRRLSSVRPATRLSAEDMAARAPNLSPEGANLVEQLMTNAVFSTLSRRQAGLITNGIVGDQHPQEAMQAITDRLRADNAG